MSAGEIIWHCLELIFGEIAVFHPIEMIQAIPDMIALTPKLVLFVLFIPLLILLVAKKKS